MDSRLVALLVLVVIVVVRRTQSRGRLPPGPPQLPIIGTVLPLEEPWRAIQEYSRKFGPLVGLRILTTNIVAVNTVEAASELFENRSSIYSQRIPMKMAELCGMDDGILFQSDPARLRQARRLVASGVAPRELSNFRPQLEAHILSFLNQLATSPEDFREHVHHLPTSALMEITYGYKSTGLHDPFVHSAETWVKNFARATHVSNYLVNWMPLLAYVPEWFPGADFQKKAAAWKKHALDFGEDAYMFVKKALVDGDGKPSVVSKAIQSENPYEKEVIVKSATQMVTGGADTTVSATLTFILAMVLHPDIQRKAQAEIDVVVGQNRLPAFADRSKLPYIDAIIREVLRWRPPVPLVPRNLTQDDTVDGFYLSKDTVVLSCFWSMLHNENIYREPDTFNPDRFMHVNITKDMDPVNIAFGFGKRECPGKQLATELLFTTFTGILAVFDISKARDATGNLITPSTKLPSESIPAPLPYLCNIKARSGKSLELLQEALDRAERS